MNAVSNQSNRRNWHIFFKLYIGIGLIAASFGGPVMASVIDENSLYERLIPAIQGDRTGVCMQLALIGVDKPGSVQKVALCADEASTSSRIFDFDTLFEIGSISKTMASVVLAGLIRDEDLSLDDTLESMLPGVKVPRFNSKEITLKHVVTHTSGLPALPSNMEDADPLNPYAKLSSKKLLASLADVRLNRAPGSQFEYSNYAMMLLSLGMSNKSGKSLDQLLDKYVFAPLEMSNSVTARSSKDQVLAKGHSQTGDEVPHWDFAKNLHGVGGIRSSMNDMVRYANANLGAYPSEATSLLSKTHQELMSVSGQSIGMNWFRTSVAGRDLVMHEGGTGGFSSLIAIDTSAKQAVVVLADTSLTSLGGLGAIALHALDSELPLPRARREKSAPKQVLEDLVGEYRLIDAGMTMTLSQKDGNLVAQASGQSSFVLAYDDHGDFYPKSFDALLRPVQNSKGWSFEWLQGGAVMLAERVGERQVSFDLSPELLDDYVGVYPLVPSFSLSVASADGELTIQGSGQSPLVVTPVKADEFSRDDVGAYFVFHRDPSGAITALTLKQGGQILRGEKQ